MTCRPPLKIVEAQERKRSSGTEKGTEKGTSLIIDLNRKLSRAKARAMIPSLERQLKRFAGQPLDYPPAETLRERIVNKDHDKLFTFLRVPGVEPTNNHAEQSLRCMVIMRKICFGTRSQAGSDSHSILSSLLQTARRQGKDRVKFLTTLLTQPLAAARNAMFADSA